MDTRAYRKRDKSPNIVFGWLFLFILALIYSISSSSPTHANSTNIILDVGTTLSLTLSSNSISASILPTASGAFSSTSFTATASTNNSTGYKLTLASKDTDTNLVHTVTSTATIPTLSSNTTKTNFPNNQWGLSLDDTNYLPTPASDGTAITVKETTAPIANDTSTVYAGAKVTTDTMSGAYTDTITISLVANPEPTNFNEAYILAGKQKTPVTTEQGTNYYYTMQDMTSNICASVTLENDEITLVDTRDNKTYTVFKSKAPDSRCWMNQNLDLDLSSDTTLTNQNTDLNSVDSWTPESPNGTTISPGNLSSSTWGSDSNNPYSYNPGDVYYYTSGTNNDDIEYTSLDNCMAAPHTATECQHYHAGNYYNWSAAVASNNTSMLTTEYVQAPDSICPKGWKLPQGPTEEGDYSDFNDLLAAYGIINDGASGSGAFLSNGFNNVRADPLFFVRIGYVISGYQYSLGATSTYQSSSAKSSEYAYYLILKPEEVRPQEYIWRYYGHSVRCLAR